jgi:hypothetical protein
MCDAWDGLQGAAMSGTNRSKMYALEPRARALAAERSVEPEALVRAAVARFKAHNATLVRKLGLSIFLEDFDQWVDDPKPRGNGGPPPAPTSPPKLPPLFDPKTMLPGGDA